VVLLTSWGGTTYPWLSAEIFGLGAGAVILAVGWWLSAGRTAAPTSTSSPGDAHRRVTLIAR